MLELSNLARARARGNDVRGTFVYSCIVRVRLMCYNVKCYNVIMC